MLKIKSAKEPTSRLKGALKKAAVWYLGGVSFKTSAYLYYFVIIILSAIVAADPEFPVLHEMDNYLSIMRYGILMLIALDKFVEQLFADLLRNRG